MGGAMEKITTIAIAIVGVAILAALVSRRANTVGVIDSAGNAFSKSLATALSPVTGGGTGMNGFVSQF